MADCTASVFIGHLEFTCSLVEHEGQHFSMGARPVCQSAPKPLIPREKRIAYRVAWSDDPAATLEV